ncbi:MAG TPA: AlkA N-terminal domain-containing protein, partial [Actinocrinis sp.]|uniref:bifunctional transcriptional activator/DNA repair enzyme AdaA n=1 Tax=Actinocrinis sp. TaxID=1920516 RepID=UPI002DDD2E70
MSQDAKYEAVRGRDARFDGEFFFAVSTTGIYCRPSCPAVTPKRENVDFFPSAAAAQGAGYRACRRCRPDAVPGSPQWNVRADSVGRAMRLIADGVVDREGVTGLATRLGYSARQLQRQLNAEVGAGPVALARAQRAHTARVLLQTTQLQASEVAFAAGFDSVRQFNDTIQAIYALTPTQLRTALPKSPASGTEGGVPLRLAYRGPYAATEIFDYLERRAIVGVEEVVGERGARTYRRTLRLPAGAAVAEVDEPGRAGGWLECRLHLGELRDLTAAIQRMRRLFDLDADPHAVAETLGADAVLGPLVQKRPGLRAPGAADPEELAVRAVLGQQVTVAAGRGLGTALVAAYGQ